MNPGDFYNPERLFTGIFIPDAMVRMSTLSPGAKLLFGRLCWHINDEGDCFPTRETLGKEIGMSESSIRDFLRELEAEKFVARLRSGPQANYYKFPWHPLLDPSVRRKKDRQPTVDQQKCDIAPPESVSDSGPRKDRQSAVKSDDSILIELREGLREVNSNSSEELSLKILLSRYKHYHGTDQHTSKAEKDKTGEWLSLRSETGDQILAALEVFVRDDYWRGAKFPLSAFRKQFNKYLDEAAALPSASDTPSRIYDGTPPVTARPSAPESTTGFIAGQIPPHALRWNSVVQDPQVVIWSRASQRALEARLAEPGFEDHFELILENCAKAAKNGHDYLSFEWLLKEGNWTKVLNGSTRWKKNDKPKSAADQMREELGL